MALFHILLPLLLTTPTLLNAYICYPTHHRPLPLASDCYFLFQTLAAAQRAGLHGGAAGLLYGRSQIDGPNTAHLPRGYQIEDPAYPDLTCAVVVDAFVADPTAEERLTLTDVIRGGQVVVGNCLKRKNMLGCENPGPQRRLEVEIKRAVKLEPGERALVGVGGRQNETGAVVVERTMLNSTTTLAGFQWPMTDGEEDARLDSNMSDDEVLMPAQEAVS